MTELARFFSPPAGHYFLFGPRGTGKTTWLRRAYPDALRLDLLAPDLERQLTARPERFRELVSGARKAGHVVVDEVQRAPGVLSVVHQMMEEPAAQTFVLTGSSARKLRTHGTDLLAGRAVVRTLHPFMAAELRGRFDLGRALEQGLLPLVWDAADPADTLAAYVALYVREEVQAEALVRRIGSFQRFLEAVSFSQGAQLNLAAVARECEVSRSTVQDYLTILEDLLLAFRLPVFTRRAQRQLAVHPKLYFSDVGIYRALRPAGPLDRPEEIGGAALEGIVAQHLRAWIDYSRNGASLSFWRTRSGREVDFVLYGPNVFCALEVKNSVAVRPDDLRSLLAFRDDYPQAELRLLYRGAHRRQISGVLCMPCEELLRELVPGRDLP